MAKKPRSRSSRAEKLGLAASDEQTPIPVILAHWIRERILRGELVPGERITETRLGKDLGVAQPSVREALFLLERQGLVRRVPNLGTFVTEFSLEEVSNLYQIRRELEGLAAELAARRVSPEEIRELRRLVEKMKAAAIKEGKWGYLQNDLAFHRRLWELSGNKQLADLLENVVPPLFVFTFVRVERRPEELANSAQLHVAIVDGVAAGPEKARQVIQENIRLFLEQYLSNILGSL